MINTLIVDDERLARAELKRLLAAHPEINVSAEAADAEQAMHLLQQQSFDLVFLDIQMPGMTGLELAEKINADCQFVFCTAFDSFALDAFSLNAIDYLVKPVNPERLSQTLSRVKPLVKTQQHYLPDQHGILLKFGEFNRIVRLHEIERFESVGNHSAVYTPYGKSFIHSSLAKIEVRLDPNAFFKANRGDIIRVDAIKQLEQGVGAGSMIAELHSGLAVEVSRRQVQSLKQLFSAFTEL